MSYPKNLSLEGRIALVTGGSRGIGKAIAIELALRGASVAINYVRSKDGAEDTVKQIENNGGTAQIFQADVSDFSQSQELAKNTIETLGGLDILVNNAGITRDKLFLKMTEEDWDVVQSTNAKGTFNCAKAAIRHMVRKKYGRIINITSVSGQMGNPGQTNYSASKAAQIGFTKALAREVASRKITVNAIAAGYIETDIWANVPEEAREWTLSIIPLGRKGEPEEIAYAAAYLASEGAAYITGQVIGVDGGMAMM